MFKKHKKKIIVSSLLILVPIIFGLIFWNELPETLSTHWGFNGEVSQSERTFSVFAIPIIMLLLHWLCLFITSKDTKNKNQNEKAFSLIFWIIPATTWFSCATIFCTALGYSFDPLVFLPLVLGIMFIVIGNYMPKLRQNSTLGIKIKPTLESESNWNATHRFAGKTSVIGGFLILFFALFSGIAVIVSVLVAVLFIVVAPMVYSYNFRKKQLKNGKHDIITRKRTKAEKYSLLIIIPILIAVAVLMFTGDIEIKYNSQSFSIDPTYWNELTVEYDAIDNIEYRDNFDEGMRTYGFGSAKLCLGRYQNSEFGSYTLYAYSKGDSAVVITVDESILVIRGESTDHTKAIFETIKNSLD